MQHIIDVTLS